MQFENTYPFTREAYSVYQSISPRQQEFWNSLIASRIIGEGDLIQYYVMEEVCDSLGIRILENPHNQKYGSIIQKLRHEEEHGDHIPMRKIFRGDTTIVFRGIHHPISEDIEKAQFIFSEYENSSEYNDSFGYRWYGYYEAFSDKITNLCK